MVDSLIETNFIQRFNERSLVFQGVTKDYPIRAVSSEMGRPYDVAIQIGLRTVAIIEFKSSSFLEIFDYSRIEKFANENNIRFFVLSDGEIYRITDRRERFDKSEVDFEGFVRKLSLRTDINVEFFKRQIATNFATLVRETLPNLLEDLGSVTPSDFEYDEIRQVFSFSKANGWESVENKVFRFLLRTDRPIRKIYRYTTLPTIFSMIEKNSFRMNCLVGMNDTTEVNYAENYITGKNRDFAFAPWQTVDAYNKRFISSCSLKKDDLTQWRLYADDSKGVCLVFDVAKNQLGGDFIIERISYGEADGTHPALDFIKSLVATLKASPGMSFELNGLKTWRHFFKPYEYQVEDEVRILYILNKRTAASIKHGWVLTSSHSILNPWIQFDLNSPSLPVRLSEIILGPKCPEKEINKKQFEQMLRQIKRSGASRRKVAVSLSTIRSYR